MSVIPSVSFIGGRRESHRNPTGIQNEIRPKLRRSDFVVLAVVSVGFCVTRQL